MDSIKDILKNTFVWKKKDDEDKGIYVISDNTPADLKSILFNNGFEIDDYYYNWFAEAFDLLIEATDEAKTIDEALAILDDYYFEDIEADVYTSDLTAWLNSNVNRVYWLEEAVGNGATNGFDILSQAQYAEKNEVFEKAKRCFIEFLELNK